MGRGNHYRSYSEQDTIITVEEKGNNFWEKKIETHVWPGANKALLLHYWWPVCPMFVCTAAAQSPTDAINIRLNQCYTVVWGDTLTV